MVKRMALVALLSVVAFSLVACNGDVKNDTAKDALESAHNLIMDKDFMGMVALAPPKHQEAAKIMMGAMEDMIEASESLEATVKSKLGEDVAKGIRSTSDDLKSPLKSVTKEDGSVDWSKVEVKEEGDKATVVVDGKTQSEKLVKIDGKWYMDMETEKSPEDFKKDAEQMRGMADKMIKAMGEVEADVQSGKLTKENFKTEYGKKMMAAMMGG